MNTIDSFVYNFINDLGKFYPIEISLLGGRFFALHSGQLPFTNENFILNYKQFLQSSLQSSYELISNENQNSIFYISWIISFIEFELVNLEYRQIHDKFIGSSGNSAFSLVFFHIFFDLFHFDSIHLDRRMQSFILRLSHLPVYLRNISNNLFNLSFSTLLELIYSLKTLITMFFRLDQTSIDQLKSLKDNVDYKNCKKTILTEIETLKNDVYLALSNFSYQPINLENRKEIFSKSVEYCLSTDLNISLTLLEDIRNKKNDFFIKYKTNLFPDLEIHEIIPALLKMSRKTLVKVENLKDEYHKVHNQIISSINQKFEIFIDKPLIFILNHEFSEILSLKNIYISSNKIKRSSTPLFILSLKDHYLGSLYLSIITEIIPYHFLLDSNISKSYIYQVLRIFDSEKACKYFLVFLYLEMEFLIPDEVYVTFFIEIQAIMDLATIDLELNFLNEITRDKLFNLINSKEWGNEILSEKTLDNLLNLPGSYFMTYYLFSSLIETYNLLQTKFEKKDSIKEILSLLKANFGAPVKVFLKEIEKLM